MTNLFKKVACFTDIHFGLKSNSKTHNEDCMAFVDWFIETAIKEGAETCIFLGDWHHNRSTTDVSTMNYTVTALEKLNNAFETVHVITGNHDQYYKDKRDLHSLAYGRLFPNINMVNAEFTQGGVTILPWLVGDEWKRMDKIKSRYIFGHFELPLFYMNAMVQMPDHGELQATHFKNQEYVFSGHFHKRQNQDKIHYIGNAFPHNYADAWDDTRGMMILEWDKEPQYIDWPQCPKYRTVKLSRLLDEKDSIMKDKMYLRVTLDIDITFEEANFIKETFMKEFDIRELSLITEKDNLEGLIEDTSDAKFESVDQIVAEQIVALETGTYNTNTLLTIYNGLHV
jgi:DNA repair exonuclease SbcCD nuclease subunit